MNTIKAVILDLDDTLCLTEAACFEMENTVLQNMGRAPMSRQLHQDTWGKPLFEVIPKRSPGVDIVAFRAAYVPIIAEFTSSGKLDAIPEQNLTALDQLTKLGKQLVVLTSRTHDELKHMLDPIHPLASRVAHYYHKDNMQYHKPDPRAFDHIEREHGWKPDECVYVGDSVGDAAAATGGGLHFVASLESGLRAREDFSAYNVDAFINTFPEIVEAVKLIEQSA